MAVPPECPEIGLADLKTCVAGPDHEKVVFDPVVYWPCRLNEAPEEPGVLPEKLPDTSLEDFGENLIPDWPEVKTAKTQAGALVASLVFHLTLILLMVGFVQLTPPEVDFDLAAGSTFLEFDMVQIAKLGGGSEELAPDETPSPEEVSDEAEPPEPEPEPEPDLTQLKPADSAPAPEIEPVPTLDLKPNEEPEEKPKEVEAKPKKAALEKEKPKPAKPKPPKAIGSPEAGGKAGTGPGNVLGSVHGNSSVGGGGAGGTKNSGGKPGWTVARRPEPRYPEASRQNKEQGRVVIMVTVLSSGKIGSASIAQSSGHSKLDQAALSAAKGIVFKPGKGGAPSGAVAVRVPYQFKLRK